MDSAGVQSLARPGWHACPSGQYDGSRASPGRSRALRSWPMTDSSLKPSATLPASGLLEGKVCIVSGVGPGLGRQAARALAAHGAHLVLAARRQASLDDVRAEVEALGGRAITVPTDITKPEQCEHL